MALSADIYGSTDSLAKPFTASLMAHAALAAAIIFSPAWVGHRGENWGGSEIGGGEAMSATLVSSVPLPANPQGQNVLATESKGLSQSVPVPEQKVEDAIPIPARNARERKPKPGKLQTPAQQKVAPAQTPARTPIREVAKAEDNRIPFGEGGPVSGPYGVFNAGGAKGGFGFSGTGGGDFGSRYAWYVDNVRRKVSENWLKYEVDPNVSTTRRVYITFDITRGGSPTNIHVEQSSGVPSLDISAMRALQRIDTFGSLPNDYAGSKVSVEFWFDYRR
ncbi:MAG TPA: TonB family protein [candidate division Zixibacteria bacterium]|nr:TonB family protein [candidate division Zixibacteria bacterium]